MQASGGNIPQAVKIRKEFPESWIYDDFDDVGLVAFCSDSASIFVCFFVGTKFFLLLHNFCVFLMSLKH